MSGSGEKKQLGRIMLQQKLVSSSGLDALLKEQRAHPEKRLASITDTLRVGSMPEAL